MPKDLDAILDGRHNKTSASRRIHETKTVTPLVSTGKVPELSRHSKRYHHDINHNDGDDSIEQRFLYLFKTFIADRLLYLIS